MKKYKKYLKKLLFIVIICIYSYTVYYFNIHNTIMKTETTKNAIELRNKVKKMRELIAIKLADLELMLSEDKDSIIYELEGIEN